MSKKPSNWYDMSWEDQKQWQRQEDERQSLEWERDRAREDTERAEAQAKRVRAEYRSELESCQEACSELYRDKQRLKGQLDQVKATLEEVRQFVASQSVICFPVNVRDDILAMIDKGMGHGTKQED